jgi:hypothetical protein
MTSVIELSGRECCVGGSKDPLLTCIGIKSGIIEYFDQHSLGIVGQRDSF